MEAGARALNLILMFNHLYIHYAYVYYGKFDVSQDINQWHPSILLLVGGVGVDVVVLL